MPQERSTQFQWSQEREKMTRSEGSDQGGLPIEGGIYAGRNEEGLADPAV